METKAKDLKEYLKLTSQDPTVHSEFRAKRLKYIQEMTAEPGRKRLRDASAVKNFKAVETKERVGRALVGRWKQAVPVDLWSSVRSEPLPGDEHQGYENISGKRTRVAYVVKNSAVPLPHHYDVEEYADTAIDKTVRIAEVNESDGSDEELDKTYRLAQDFVSSRTAQAFFLCMCIVCIVRLSKDLARVVSHVVCCPAGCVMC